jgi:hypothetical protein
MSVEIDAYGAGSPPVYCPIPLPAIMPTGTLIQDTVAWVERFGFAHGEQARLLATAGVGFTLPLASFADPAPDPERVRDLAYYTALGYYLDNVTEYPDMRGSLADLTGFLLRFVRIAEAPDSYVHGAHPGLDAMQYVMSRLRTWASPAQLLRYTESFRMWMLACLEEAALRIRGWPLDLNSYVGMRGRSVGGDNGIAFVELLFDVELSATERGLPLVKAATEAVATIAGLDNDRYSRAKPTTTEADEGPDLFDIIQHDKPDCSFAQALTEGIAIRDQIVSLYMNLREPLQKTSSQLNHYVSALDAVVAGNLLLGMTNLRYLAPDHPVPDPSHWVTHSPNTTLDPLPIPDIAWWWQHISTTDTLTGRGTAPR